MIELLPRTAAATLAALAALSAWAQSNTTVPAERATPPEYRSVFEGYQRYSDQEIAPWRESNDTVGRIGGWRAYANEARGATGTPSNNPHAGHGSSSPAPKAPASAPGGATAPSTAKDPHAGHGKQ